MGGRGILSRSIAVFAAFVTAALVLQFPLATSGAAIWPDVAAAANIPPGPNAVTADFTFTPAKPATGELVTFTATASGGTPPLTYTWSFGDPGGVGTGQIVTHSYSTPNTYTVMLTVTESDPPPPNTTTVSKQIVVTLPLTADFTFLPTNPAVGQTVMFSGTQTGGTSPYTYSWAFGDSTTGSGQNVGHAFPSSGTFTVTLTVTDSGGPPAHVATRSKPVTVAPALVADFTFSPTNPVIGQSVAFSATSTAGGTPPYTYSWTFGDGGTAAGQTPTHAYASAATFTVTLAVTDSVGRVDPQTKFITVTGVLTIDFTFLPTNPVVGQAVTFSATASGGTPSYTFSWTFGDGTMGVGQTVSHAYGSSGDFTVTLTVSDSASHVASRSKPITVIGPIVADFTFSPTNPVISQSVAFSATATGGTPPYTYSWTFGDGGTGAGQTANHAYATAATFTVTLRVTDSAARFVTVSKPVTVTSGLGASFTFSPAKPSVGEVVTFNGTAVGGTAPYTFSWTFGDGAAGQGATVSHVYGFSGTFTVILTVIDAVQRTATTSKSIAVTPALDGDITVSQAKPMIGETVNFSADAVGGTPPYSFGWTFGDGGTAVGRNASHVYATAGTFTVTLRVTDSVSHVHTSSLPLPVSPRLVAAFTFTPLDPVVGEDVYFTGTASGGTGPYEYLWTFGDGTTGIGFGPAHEYASVGSFAVVLTVFDSASHRTNVTKTVAVSPALATNLSVSQAHPVVGERIGFSASAAGGSPPYTFTWEFGDGSNAKGAAVFHAYATDGSFDPTVTATDASGRRGVADLVLVVTPRLTADFSPPQNASARDRIDFAADIEGGTSPYNVTWAFGDGSTGIGPIANHSYAAAGTFTVSLAVSDSANHTAAVSKPVAVVGSLSAQAAFSPSKPIVGERITFTGNASGGTAPYAYNWRFGDGTIGTGAAVTHFYVNATRFNVTLNVTDALGRFAVVILVVLTTPNLAVSFRFEPTMPITGRPITLVPIVSGGIPPYTYAWTFGDPDGSTSDEEQPTHLYVGSNLIATFRVSLQVCDSAGHCISAAQDVTIVNWVQVATIGVSVAIASILVLWFVRRFRAQRGMFRSAGQTAWTEASRFKRDVAGRVRHLRNDKFRRGPESGGNR